MSCIPFYTFSFTSSVASHRAKEEVKRIQSVPLVIGQFNEMIDAHYGIVGSTGENAGRK